MKLGLGLGLGLTQAAGASGPTLNISAMSLVSDNAYYYGGECPRLREIAINDDGTKLIAVGQSNDKLFSYTMSTPWDLGTISKDAFEITMATLGDGEYNPQGLHVSPDGGYLFYSGFYLSTVFRRPLSTPWDLSSIQATDKSFVLPGLTGMFVLSYDGMHLYCIDATISSDTVRQYNLSTPWDISTAVDSGKTYEFTDLGTVPLWFTQDGSQLVVAALLPDDFYQYTLSTPWDISTAVSTGNTLDFSTPTGDTHCSGFVIKPDDFSTLIMAGGTTKYMYQFSV